MCMVGKKTRKWNKQNVQENKGMIMPITHLIVHSYVTHLLYISKSRLTLQIWFCELFFSRNT